MSSDRRFEYDKGPRLEEVDSSEERDDEADADADERDRSVGPTAAVVAGLVSGATALVTVMAVIYQFVASMDAAGYLGGSEEGPSRWVMARLMGLANHGVPMEAGGETIEGGFTLSYVGGLATPITSLIPVAVLLAAGYLLVRHVRLETRVNVGIALGSFVASYVVLALVLASTVEWTPEGEDAEPISLVTDFGAAMSITRTALAFVAVGAAIAALPRILEAAPIDLARDAD